MSDAKQIADEIRDVAEIQPIIDGVEKIAQHATKMQRETETKIAELDSKVKTETSRLNEKMEKGFGDVLDRVDDLSKRASVFGRMNFEQDDLAALKSAIPERYQKHVGDYEAEANAWRKGSILNDARGAAATAAWLKLASRVQMRAFAETREQDIAELRKLNEVFSKIDKAAMAGGVDTSGGYSVPNIVGNEVLKIIRDASDIYGRARQLTMTSDTLSFPDETTAVTIYWSNTDGTTLTGGEPVFGQKQLVARKLIGRATFSLELLDDSNVAILPFLQSCFAEKMGGELDFQAMEGSGSPFTGVSGATSVQDCARTNGTNGVALTYASSLSTQASLVQIFTKAAEKYTRDQGVFICNPGVYSRIIGLTDTNGQPIVRLGTVEGMPNNTLFGRPIIVSNRLPNTTVGAGTVSVGGLYFGPPSALLFGTRQGFRWDVSDQVSWATYSADARMVGRFAYVVGVPTAWAKQLSIIV